MIFFLIFLFLPLIEISVFITVGKEIGIWNTILFCILAAVAGSILVRIQGFKTITAIQAHLGRGQMPLQEVFDGLCIALAGVLLMLPGFFTDIVGFSLLVPPLRARLRNVLMARFGLREMKTGEGDVIDGEFQRVDRDQLLR